MHWTHMPWVSNQKWWLTDLSRSMQDTGIQDTGIQYRRQKKDEVKGFIPKPVAQLESGTVYQHQGKFTQTLFVCSNQIAEI